MGEHTEILGNSPASTHTPAESIKLWWLPERTHGAHKPHCDFGILSSICSWQMGPAAPDARWLRKPSSGLWISAIFPWVAWQPAQCSCPRSRHQTGGLWVESSVSACQGRVRRRFRSIKVFELLGRNFEALGGASTGEVWPRRNFEIHVGRQRPGLHKMHSD